MKVISLSSVKNGIAARRAQVSYDTIVATARDLSTALGTHFVSAMTSLIIQSYHFLKKIDEEGARELMIAIAREDMDAKVKSYKALRKRHDELLKSHQQSKD